MGTIGLAHRAHTEFVVEWDEPEPSSTEIEEGLATRVELARARARTGDRSEPTQTSRDARTAEAPDEPETWLAGEPMF